MDFYWTRSLIQMEEFFDNGKHYLPKEDAQNDKDDEDW